MSKQKVKYYYDNTSASFKIVSPARWEWMKYAVIVVFASLVLAVLMSWVFLQNYQQKTSGASYGDITQIRNQYALLERSYDMLSENLKDVEKRDNEIYRTFFGLDTIERPTTTNAKKQEYYRELSRLAYGELIARVTEKSDELHQRLKLENKSLNQLMQMAKTKEQFLMHLPAIQPVGNKDLKRIASGFGSRMHPILRYRKMHYGLDFKADVGTPVYATAHGIVETSDWMGGYGKVVVINHDNGYKTFYAHLNAQNVRKGQKVERGQAIGQVGNTGLSSGPHLHYEVQKGEEKVNPIAFFYGDLTPSELATLQEASDKIDVSFD